MLRWLRALRTCATLLVLGALASCAPNEGYGIVVTFEPAALRANATAVELFVVPSCAAVAVSTGATPTDSIVRGSYTLAGTSTMPLGNVPPGTYGLYGRARSTGCGLVAAGCIAFEVRRGETHGARVSLVLRPATGMGCASDEMCVAGVCVSNRPDVVDVVMPRDASDAVDVARDMNVPDITDVPTDVCTGACTCTGGETFCGGRCVDTRTDIANCGACGNACSQNNATATCANGTCSVTCTGGHRDCDGNPANGCEADLDADSSCGSCTACTGSAHCVNRTCQACGGANAACCTADLGCVSGYACDFASSTCRACNANQGEPCCGYSTTCSATLDCTRSTPTTYTCQPSCGAIGESCCGRYGAECESGAACNPQSSHCEHCGAPGEICCPGTTGQCTGGTVCSFAGRCVAACGANGQPCCAATPACTGTSISCNTSSGNCEPCGQIGQTCCNGSCPSGRACSVDTRCVAACGGTGQPCCIVGSCNTGGCQTDHTCGACGAAGQTCCATDILFAPPCLGDNVCGGSSCVPCGGAGQSCCPPTAIGDLVPHCNGTRQCAVDNMCVTACGGAGQPCCYGIAGQGICTTTSLTCNASHVCQ